jgi:hypothetical protein
MSGELCLMLAVMINGCLMFNDVRCVTSEWLKSDGGVAIVIVMSGE